MTLITHAHARLKSLGLDCEIDGKYIKVNAAAGRHTRIEFEEGWEETYKKYRSARSLAYEADKRTLVYNNAVEVQLTRLATTNFASEEYVFRDSVGNEVKVGPASQLFSLSMFDSVDYEPFYKTRLQERFANSSISRRRFGSLIWSMTTATYCAKGRKTLPDLKEKALLNIRNSLFKLAVEEHESLSIWQTRGKRLRSVLVDADIKHTTIIPRANYDSNVVSYYKIAKASPFPSQSFLSYYHVLEYYFLRVSEDLLHHRLTAMLNNPGFRTDRDKLDQLIASVRGQDARSDETEMLRNVLNRFVPESELIEFIAKFEEACGQKVYTTKRKVFGEQIHLSLQEGHALSNSAKALKHIRNAIVHSSDRYKREDCHVPLSDSEGVIDEFLPLIRFLAEKVIYGTAT